MDEIQVLNDGRHSKGFPSPDFQDSIAKLPDLGFDRCGVTTWFLQLLRFNVNVYIIHEFFCDSFLNCLIFPPLRVILSSSECPVKTVDVCIFYL